MKKECDSGSFRFKQNSGSLSRAVSWINFSSLSRQTKRLFRSDGELSICGQQVEEDDENWTYRTQCRKAVSNLEEESRWTVHYTAPWHQQENVFLPTTRPPCVEDLHRQAKLNLKSVLRECDKLRRDGYRSSQYYSQGPTFSTPSSTGGGSYPEEDEGSEQKGSVSSEEEKLILVRRPRTPTSSDCPDINTHTNWIKPLPLPTPEEKMRQQAQTVQMDVVPINVTATGGGQSDFRGHSLYAPEHCSTLGRMDGYRSALQRSETRDSSCQTDEVKVVPPSVRRIRAQKGQGIAAQMSQLSNSSSNMSVLSDSAGIVGPSRLSSEVGFHSLPRPGTRVSLQPLDRAPTGSDPAEDLADLLPFQMSKTQGADSPVLVGCGPWTGALPRPQLREPGHFESEKGPNPACVVSPHTTYSTCVIPNATLSSSSEVIVIHMTQSSGQPDGKIGSSSSSAKTKTRDYPAAVGAVKDDHQSSSGNWSESSSTRHSQTSDTLCDPAICPGAPGDGETGPQNPAYGWRNNSSFPNHSQDSDGRSESSGSGDRGYGGTEHWAYKSPEKASPLRPPYATPGFSTPISNRSNSSLDRTSVREDASSLYSVDHDGYYTSMHTDSGLKSGSRYGGSNGFGHPRPGAMDVPDGKAPKNPGDRTDCCDRSLSRNISLKKAKKPPLPPSRTDSLQRAPKKGAQSNGQVLNETLIATLQHSLQLNLRCQEASSPSQSPCSDYEEPWLLRSRSQSTVSASSSMMSAMAPNVYSLCPVTPSQSDTSSVRSEYTDPWGYYIDYTGVPEDPAKTGGPPYPPAAVAPPGDDPASRLHDGSRAPLPPGPGGGAAKPKNASPEKSHRVTSPSSGYSSQSNTPTALTPVPVFLKSASPGNGKPKLKPKVPERKSSLISSVSISSSSTSLSSNTSAEGSVSVKRSDPVVGAPAPPPSPPRPPRTPEQAPLPPPPPSLGAMGLPPQPPSPLFPPPPPEALTPFSSGDQGFPPPPPSFSTALSDSPTPFPSPLSPPGPSSVPPPAPPLDPRLMKDARPSFRKHDQPESANGTLKQPSRKEESPRPPMPLITTQVLQTVQLRPVKKTPGPEVAPSVGSPTGTKSQGKITPGVPHYPLKPSLPPSAQNSSEEEIKTQVASVKSTPPTPSKSSRWGQRDNAAQPIGLQSLEAVVPPARPSEAPVAGTDGEEAAPAPGPAEKAHPGLSPARLQERPGSPKETRGPPSSRKPPPISKKPKLLLVVPPPQIDFTDEQKAQAREIDRSTPSPTRRRTGATGREEARDCLEVGPGADEPDCGRAAPEGGADSTVREATEANASMVQPAASPAREAPRQEEETTATGKSVRSESGRGPGGHGDLPPSQEDGRAGVFEVDSASPASQPGTSGKEEDGDEVMTPSRPRTTEDLFAAIHRSKRKVLGRKDSDEDHSRNHSPSPPVTPTSAAPTLASLKQPGSIQRSLRKSSTSSDNFKALLLKKGSRSDTGSRMSAAEMLKTTDPRSQRAKAEPSPDSPDGRSPSGTRRAQEEWVKTEGLMPRSLSFSGARYGRSRTPPSAASSRYSLRNRIQSSPMTVISEGDGEGAEGADGRGRRTPGAGREEPLGRCPGGETPLDDRADATEAAASSPLGPAARTGQSAMGPSPEES
ncbi:NHS-like protein 1 isoform X2 [Ornithorhynchus anatinus]|uniref:NHS-like protein 1 isoform X2 n=1 Tax=Ornithorhynchus anatinus TaxID=9258 RepID=UPI0010A90695|nr:NHS-like protein 1 isoform X2 [Ornithorhynchus anatinus]